MLKNDIYLIRKLEESSGYFQSSYSNRYSNWKRYYSIRKAFFRQLQRLNRKEPIKILEIGCYEGDFIYRLKAEFSKKYKLKFFGIDISHLDINFANQRKKYFAHQDCYFLVMDVQKLGFIPEVFDIIIASEVIEHLPEPQEALKQIYCILKKDGLFILTTPNKGGSLLAKFLHFVSSKINISPTYNFISENEIAKIRLSSEQGLTGSGCGHISVKDRKQWQLIFKNIGFRLITTEGTSGLLFGLPSLDRYRILFALTVILDVILEKLPFSYLWSETLFFTLRK